MNLGNELRDFVGAYEGMTRARYYNRIANYDPRYADKEYRQQQGAYRTPAGQQQIEEYRTTHGGHLPADYDATPFEQIDAWIRRQTHDYPNVAGTPLTGAGGTTGAGGVLPTSQQGGGLQYFDQGGVIAAPRRGSKSVPMAIGGAASYPRPDLLPKPAMSRFAGHGSPTMLDVPGKAPVLQLKHFAEGDEVEAPPPMTPGASMAQSFANPELRAAVPTPPPASRPQPVVQAQPSLTPGSPGGESFGSVLDQALIGGARYANATYMGGNGAIQGVPNPQLQGQGTQALMSHDGMADPRAIQAFDQRFKPASAAEIDDAVWNIKRMELLYEYKMSHGDSAGADRMAYELMQYGNYAAAKYGMRALQFLQGGDMQAATQFALAGLNQVPDGNRYQINQDGKVDAIDVKTGKVVGSYPLTGASLYRAIHGLAQGSLQWQMLQQRVAQAIAMKHYKSPEEMEQKRLNLELTKARIERLRRPSGKGGGGGALSPAAQQIIDSLGAIPAYGATTSSAGAGGATAPAPQQAPGNDVGEQDAMFGPLFATGDQGGQAAGGEVRAYAEGDEVTLPTDPAYQQFMPQRGPQLPPFPGMGGTAGPTLQDQSVGAGVDFGNDPYAGPQPFNPDPASYDAPMMDRAKAGYQLLPGPRSDQPAFDEYGRVTARAPEPWEYDRNYDPMHVPQRVLAYEGKELKPLPEKPQDPEPYPYKWTEAQEAGRQRLIQAKVQAQALPNRQERIAVTKAIDARLADANAALTRNRQDELHYMQTERAKANQEWRDEHSKAKSALGALKEPVIGAIAQGQLRNAIKTTIDDIEKDADAAAARSDNQDSEKQKEENKFSVFRDPKVISKETRDDAIMKLMQYNNMDVREAALTLKHIASPGAFAKQRSFIAHGYDARDGLGGNVIVELRGPGVDGKKVHMPEYVFKQLATAAERLTNANIARNEAAAAKARVRDVRDKAAIADENRRVQDVIQMQRQPPQPAPEPFRPRYR